ncbi:hypothetical protein ABPG72_019257 [Tetrahymena utriculariae]
MDLCAHALVAFLIFPLNIVEMQVRLYSANELSFIDIKSSIIHKSSYLNPLNYNPLKTNCYKNNFRFYTETVRQNVQNALSIMPSLIGVPHLEVNLQGRALGTNKLSIQRSSGKIYNTNIEKARISTYLLPNINTLLNIQKIFLKLKYNRSSMLLPHRDNLSDKKNKRNLNKV